MAPKGEGLVRFGLRETLHSMESSNNVFWKLQYHFHLKLTFVFIGLS